MSACELRIEFDREPRIYQTGDTLAGTVHVHTETDLDAEIVVKLFWRTSGFGNVASETVHEETLSVGRLLPETRHELLFSVTIPEGPCTYHGQILNVDWCVEARAKRDWRRDPKTEEDFIVEPNAQRASGEHDDEPCEVVPEDTDGASILFGSGLNVIGLILFSIGIYRAFIASGITFDRFFDNILWLFFGLIAMIAGSKIAWTAFRNKMAMRKLGDVHIVLTSEHLRRGDTLGAAVSFEPRDTVEIERISLHLTAVEEATSGSGTNSETKRNEVLSLRERLHDRATLQPGTPISISGAITIPDSAPLSFGATDNALVWEAKVLIEIPGWPDWTRTNWIEINP